MTFYLKIMSIFATDSVTSADEYSGLDHVADVVAHSWMAFDLAERNGYHLNVLDVGGCFPARHQVHSLSEVSVFQQW